MVGRWTWVCDFLEFDLSFSEWMRLLKKKPQNPCQIIFQPCLRELCYNVVVISVISKLTILSSLSVMQVIKCHFDNSEHIQSFCYTKDKHHDRWNGYQWSLLSNSQFCQDQENALVTLPFLEWSWFLEFYQLLLSWQMSTPI